MSVLAPSSDLEPFRAIDAEIVDVARSIRILSHLTWPGGLRERFLDRWRAGRPELPEVELDPVDHGPQLVALERIMARCDRDHPVGDHLFKTAWSYATAGRMLASIGTPAFSEYSIALYGRPDHVYERQQMSAMDGADSILAVTDDLLASDAIMRTVPDIPAEDFADRLRAALGSFFDRDPVEVVVDPTMSAKAAAGSKRVKVQAGAMFSDLDLAQLLNHEAFVHTATSLNGKHQPLAVLGLGSPRTTKTQEGLAVFSELITYSIDLVRLRRVALRAQAVRAALEGADFIEVFGIYLEGGQSETDAYNSAQRVFRGGDVRGGIAFTKDGAYLEGLLLVQTFLRKAIGDGRADLVPLLFSGRLTLGDVLELEPVFDAGSLRPPRYLPEWAVGLRRLSAYLAYSLVSGRIRMDVVDLSRFSELEDGAMEAHLHG